MKTRAFTFTVVTALVALFAISGSSFAAKGGIPGPPTDGGGGGAPDLGDLIVLYRDAWGLPILTGDLCQQPLAASGEILPPAGDLYLGCTPEPDESCVIPVDSDCAIVAGYDTYTQEVDFGRTSVIRSPVTVIEQSLGEVITKLATAQCTTLDPAGRLVNTSKIDDVVLSATIDSPLESLAIYRQLMLTGYLGADETAIVLPDENVLNMAARGLGAAADKTGKVTVDQVAYTNEIMGLTEENVQTYLPKICMNVREEVQGTVQQVRKCFLNYGDAHPELASIGGTIADYQYDRAENFLALPAPPYIPEEDVDLGTTPLAGWFEYLALYPDATTIDGDPLFQILQGPITNNVFPGAEDLEANNIGGFTQAADDTREVIEFTHDRPLPLGYETPVPLCDAPDTDLDYDVSISEESGLQVPKRMVAGAEEPREIIVTVANEGPDTATGSVTLTGEDASGVVVFNETDEFEITGGGTNVSEWGFSLTYATTVSWTATAIAEFDLNTGNNTVTATTKVMTTGGGGGQGGPQ